MINNKNSLVVDRALGATNNQGKKISELGSNFINLGSVSEYAANRERSSELGPNFINLGSVLEYANPSYENTPLSPEITQSEAFWNSLKHGLSFNLDDEIAGIVAAGRDDENESALNAFRKGLYRYWLSGDKKYEEKYEKEANRIRDYQRRMSDTHYWTSLLGNVVGAALPSLATLGTGAVAGLAGRIAPSATSKLGQTFLKAVPTPVGTGGKWVGAGVKYVGGKASPFLGITKNTTLPHLLKVGAASGALHGAGEGVGLGHTLQSAAVGGGLGAAGTVVGSALGHLAGSTVGGIRRLLSPSHTKEGVSKDTLRAISKHLGNEASEDLGKSFKNAVSTDYVADHSPFLQDLVFDIAKRNQGAYLDLTKRAGQRALGGGERIHQAADEHFVPRQNVTGLKDDLIAIRKAEPHTLYEIAQKTPIGEQHYGALNELMKRPYFKQAYKGGLQEFTSGGKEVSSFSSEKFNLLKEKPNMGVLHETKVKLGLMRDEAEKIGDNSKVHTLVGIQKKLLELMDDISPKYKKAR
ncbi:hypothetical protein, partial [Bartonella sp. CE47NXGY]|uniref:hypothetical protein n=1 Tax=Bartonella sp. CE47NXGY TaxID=3243514 RepID=UPI0035CFDC0D